MDRAVTVPDATSAEEADDKPTAERLYRRVMKMDPGDPAAAFNLGNLLRSTGRGVEAEAAFRTAKYCPLYPTGGLFASVEAAREWMIRFADWYNDEHLHSGIRFVTPAQRHDGRDVAILKCRTATYQAAKKRNPERWSGAIRNWTRIAEVTLNPPPDVAETPAA